MMSEYAVAANALNFGAMTNKEFSDLTPAQWLAEQDLKGAVIAAHLPYDIAEGDDFWLSRAEWDTHQRGLVVFVAVPRDKKGEGGSNPLLVVASLAVAVLAPWAAGAILGTTSGLAFTALSAGIGIAGQSLVTKSLGVSPTPTNAAQSAASPTYSNQVSGNQARINESIPVQYGEVVFPPEYIQSPYIRFYNPDDDEYFYGLYCLGLGAFELLDVGFGLGIDLSVTEMDGVTIELINDQHGASTPYYPASRVGSGLSGVASSSAVSTIMPSVSYVAPDISNFEVDSQGWSRWFMVVPRFAVVNDIWFNVMFPGLYEQVGSDETLHLAAAYFAIEVMPIDDEGNQVGSIIEHNTIGTLGSTIDTIRHSYNLALPSGKSRYKVRVRRETDISETPKLANKIIIHSIVSHDKGADLPGGCTYLALKVKATGQLSGSQNNQLYVHAKRILPKLDPDAILGYDASDANYNKPQSAVADMLRSHYGLNAGGSVTSNAHLDYLPAVSEFFNMSSGMSSPASSRFNFRFDSATPLMDAITIAMRPCLATPYIMGGSIYFAVARQSDQIAQRVVEGVESFTEGVAMPRSLQSTGVEVEYWDARYNRLSTVLCRLTDDVPLLTDKINVYGVNSVDDAYGLGMRHLMSATLQSTDYSYETDIRGRVPFPQDLVDLGFVHQMGAQTGAISSIDQDGSKYVLSLSDDPVIDYSGSGVAARLLVVTASGQQLYFAIDSADEPAGICEIIIDSSQSALSGLLAQAGNTFGMVDNPLRYVVLLGDEEDDLTKYRGHGTPCRVLSVEPGSDGKVKVNAVADSPLLYQSFGFAAEGNTKEYRAFNSAAYVAGLEVTVMPSPVPTSSSVTVRVSWSHYNGASSYTVGLHGGMTYPYNVSMLEDVKVNERFMEISGLLANGDQIDMSRVFIGVRPNSDSSTGLWRIYDFNLIS